MALSLVLPVAAVAVAAWLRPTLGAAFIASGAIAYYALLDTTGVPVTPELSAAVYVAAGVTSLVRQYVRAGRWSGGGLKLACLFLAFCAIWQLRWMMDAPQTLVDVKDVQFAERSRAFMLVFAATPFLLGLTFGDPRWRKQVIADIAMLGGIGLAVVIGLLLSGRSTQGLGYRGRWEPLPGVSGINMSIEIGLSCVAFLMVAWRKKGMRWTAARAGWICAALGMQLVIGQRGPFLFTLVAIALFVAANPAAKGWSRMLLPGAVVGVLLATLAAFAPVLEDNSVLHASSYVGEENRDREDLLGVAFRALAQRPAFGWGGGLVGARVGDSTWSYSHVFTLDPLIETGLLGATPFLLLFGMVFVRAWRSWADGNAVSIFHIMPMFALVFLEAHVSGHVSTVKHLWLMTGLLGAASGAALPMARLPPRSVRQFPVRFSRRSLRGSDGELLGSSGAALFAAAMGKPKGAKGRRPSSRRDSGPT